MFETYVRFGWIGLRVVQTEYLLLHGTPGAARRSVLASWGTS